MHVRAPACNPARCVFGRRSLGRAVDVLLRDRTLGTAYPDDVTSSPPAETAQRRPPSVLVVCTGNICRSPFAELLLRDRLPNSQVASRGIFAVVGNGIEPHMAGELAARGIEHRGFHARQVHAVDLDVDLVLTMSRRQRSHLLEEFPEAARRIGHIGHVPELLRGAEALPTAPLRETIQRWTRRPLDPQRDIPDPFGRDAAVAAGTAALLTELVDQLVQVLEGATSQP